MSKYPIEIELRKGQKGVVRPLEIGDKEKLKGFFVGFPSEETKFLKGERNDIGFIEKWIKESLKQLYVPLVAEVKEKIIALISCRQPKDSRSEHFRDIVLLVDLEYRPSRIRSVLSKELFDKILAEKKKKPSAE